MTPLLLGLALTLGAPATKDKDKDKPAPKLEGTWAVEKIEGKGDKEVTNTTFTFEDGKIKIKEGGRDRSEDAAFTSDATKKPGHIDIKPDRGGKDMTIQGIYEFDADTLKICFAFDGGDRPTEFKADMGKRQILIVLKKAKAEK